MGFDGKRSAILFLDRNRFDLYIEGSKNVLSLPFHESVVNAMDVINPTELENQIRTVVEQNAIGPAIITIILSPNVVFEKDIAVTDPQEKEQEIEKFKETVPFENIYTQLLPFNSGVRIIAVNRDLCDSIKNSFEKLGSAVDSIVSYIALGEANNILGLDIESSTQILKNMDSLRRLAFPIEGNINSQTSIVKKTPQTNKPNIKLYSMIGVFTFLIIILLILILRG